MRYISADYIKAIMKNDRLMQGNCEYELWKQEVEKIVDAMPSIEVMDVVTAYQQGWCDALDASINALNDAKFQLGNADRKTEPQKECSNCKNKGFEGCEQPCLECGWCDVYEPKDEPQTEPLEQFRVGLEYHTDTSHFGKTKGESVTTNKIEDEPQTEVKIEPSWVGETYGHFKDEQSGKKSHLYGKSADSVIMDEPQSGKE